MEGVYEYGSVVSDIGTPPLPSIPSPPVAGGGGDS